jgi:hypothetical protein
MTTAIEYFRIVGKQFAVLSDAEVQIWLDIAGTLGAAGCLMGDPANLATALYAAHMLQLDGENTSGEGGRGPIKSEKEGDLMRTYVTTASGETWFTLSPYGQQYSQMQLGCTGAGIMTRYGSEVPQGVDLGYLYGAYPYYRP